MRKIIALIIALLLAVAMFVWILFHNVYANLTWVVAVNRNTHIVTVEDFNGHLWQFCDDEDQWDEGNLVNLVMFDMFTAEITDDIIVRTLYERW